MGNGLRDHRHNNGGAFFPKSAQEGGAFRELCSQRRDPPGPSCRTSTGFMVGREIPRTRGSARHGPKMVTAVARTAVPQGDECWWRLFGRGDIKRPMAGRAYSPRFSCGAGQNSPEVSVDWAARRRGGSGDRKRDAMERGPGRMWWPRKEAGSFQRRPTIEMFRAAVGIRLYASARFGMTGVGRSRQGRVRCWALFAGGKPERARWKGDALWPVPDVIAAEAGLPTHPTPARPPPPPCGPVSAAPVPDDYPRVAVSARRI